jgi:uncharacterized membrane protein
MSIIPVNNHDRVTGFGWYKFRRNSTLHLLCSNINKFFTLFIGELRMAAAQRKGAEMKMVGLWA